MIRALHVALLWLTERDLQIARSTGRNRECIANLSARVQDHEAALFRIDNPLVGG